MMFSRADLDTWMGIKGSANAGYSQLTRTVLQYGGGDISLTDPYAFIFRIPPTVTNYEQCFESMISNSAFAQHITDISE